MEAFKIYEKPVMIGLWFFLKNNVNCLSLNFKFVLRGVVEITAAPQPDGRRFDNSWEPFFSFFFQIVLGQGGGAREGCFDVTKHGLSANISVTF